MKTTLFLFLSLAAVAFAGEPEHPLPGCYIPLSELATTSKGVLVATLLSVGPAEPGPSGASDFDSRWKVVQTLRGHYPPEAKLDFRVQEYPEQHRERSPVVGQTYILVSYDINPNQVAYIFDYTEAKQHEIERLFSTKPK